MYSYIAIRNIYTTYIYNICLGCLKCVATRVIASLYQKSDRKLELVVSKSKMNKIEQKQQEKKVMNKLKDDFRISMDEMIKYYTFPNNKATIKAIKSNDKHRNNENKKLKGVNEQWLINHYRGMGSIEDWDNYYVKRVISIMKKMIEIKENELKSNDNNDTIDDEPKIDMNGFTMIPPNSPTTPDDSGTQTFAE